MYDGSDSNTCTILCIDVDAAVDGPLWANTTFQR